MATPEFTALEHRGGKFKIRFGPAALDWAPATIIQMSSIAAITKTTTTITTLVLNTILPTKMITNNQHHHYYTSITTSIITSNIRLVRHSII